MHCFPVLCNTCCAVSCIFSVFFVIHTHTQLLTLALNLALVTYQFSVLAQISTNQSHILPSFDHTHSSTDQSHRALQLLNKPEVEGILTSQTQETY